jgi:hypothetical protein
MIDAPPCPPPVAPAAELRARDVEDDDRALTATHTIVIGVTTAEREIDEARLTLPPGVEARRVGPYPAFQADSPGQVPVTATWTEYDPLAGSDCTASATTTFAVAPAKPLRFVPPPRRAPLMTELLWRVPIGDEADLRPVEMRVRGSTRARLPGRGAPLRKLVFALRRGDRGLAFTGPPERIRRAAGWAFAGGFARDGAIRIAMRGMPAGRGFGFALELVQAGRRIGRTRAVGRCGSYTCSYRTVGRAP